jgi:hypothetical protein
VCIVRRLRRQVRPACRITRQIRLWLTDPPSTRQRFGHTTIAIESLGFTNFLESGTQPLIVFLVSRRTTVLVVPLPVDSQ